MDTQTIDILAIIGGSFGLIAMIIYYFRATSRIHRAKFERFARAASLHKPSPKQQFPPKLAQVD